MPVGQDIDIGRVSSSELEMVSKCRNRVVSFVLSEFPKELSIGTEGAD